MTVVIRVDADPVIGSGHFMRMIALAQLLRDHGREVHVVTACRNELCDAYLAEERLPVHTIPPGADTAADAHALRTVAATLDATWVVLDGAKFVETYQRTVREGGHRVMSVDDYALGHFVSDVVLNQNYGTEAFAYSTEPYTTRLLGIHHVLLRREFRAMTPPARDARKRSLNVLVTLGGARKPGLLPHALEAALAGGGDVSVTLVVGAFQALEADLEAVCRRAGARVSVVRQNRRMAEVMAWADAAIAGAGSTMWELLYMRVPFLAVPLDPAHEPFVDRMAVDGLCARGPATRALSGPELAERASAFLSDAGARAAILARSANLVDPRRAWRTLDAVLV